MGEGEVAGCPLGGREGQFIKKKLAIELVLEMGDVGSPPFDKNIAFIFEIERPFEVGEFIFVTETVKVSMEKKVEVVNEGVGGARHGACVPEEGGEGRDKGCFAGAHLSGEEDHGGSFHLFL